MQSTDDAIDELFASPPEEFTPARNELAKRVKADGDAEAAARVMKLRKPVRSAWALNRLVRDDRPAVETLLSAGERLRAAQMKALSQKGAPGLREASSERDALVQRLTREAARVLGEPNTALADEIAATLEAASVDESAAGMLLEARLSKPLPRPTGFGDVVGLKIVEDAGEGAPSTRGRGRRGPSDREIQAAERRVSATRERAQRLRDEIASLKERVEEREEHLRAAEAEARGAAAALKRLQR